MRAFRLAYDGRSYHGYQRQPDVRTVEGRLFAALRELGLAEPSAAPPGYTAAGRTDAGASAVAQTITLECPDWCTPRALNGSLPTSIRAWASVDVPTDFHATHDAVRREYTYVDPAPTADMKRAQAVARHLAGKHDFHNLTPDEHGTVRELSLSVERDGEFLVFSVSSDGFPRQLVRRLVWFVHTVATGDSPIEMVDRILSAAPLDGADGIPPAPADGLVLTQVEYPGVEFTVDDQAIAEARSTFDSYRSSARREARAMSQVIDGLSGD